MCTMSCWTLSRSARCSILMIGHVRVTLCFIVKKFLTIDNRNCLDYRYCGIVLETSEKHWKILELGIFAIFKPIEIFMLNWIHIKSEIDSNQCKNFKSFITNQVFFPLFAYLFTLIIFMSHVRRQKKHTRTVSNTTRYYQAHPLSMGKFWKLQRIGLCTNALKMLFARWYWARAPWRDLICQANFVVHFHFGN